MRQQINHEIPAKPEHSPYITLPQIYGAGAQDTITPNMTTRIDDKRIKIVQQGIGGCLYHGRAADNTIIPALSDIASEQLCAT